MQRGKGQASHELCLHLPSLKKGETTLFLFCDARPINDLFAKGGREDIESAV